MSFCGISFFVTIQMNLKQILRKKQRNEGWTWKVLVNSRRSLSHYDLSSLIKSRLLRRFMTIDRQLMINQKQQITTSQSDRRSTAAPRP